MPAADAAEVEGCIGPCCLHQWRIIMVCMSLHMWVTDAAQRTLLVLDKKRAAAE